MKTLRLIYTPICNRRCEGCCNKDYDLNNLPRPEHFDYEQIIITGGEPMLFVDELIGFIKAIRVVSKAKIIVYTALIDSDKLTKVLKYVDGITLTLHEKKDWEVFNDLSFTSRFPPEVYFNKSMRLNIFKEAGADLSLISPKWKVKPDMEWIKNCPVPENEVLMKFY